MLVEAHRLGLEDRPILHRLGHIGGNSALLVCPQQRQHLISAVRSHAATSNGASCSGYRSTLLPRLHHLIRRNGEYWLRAATSSAGGKTKYRSFTPGILSRTTRMAS